MAKSSAALKEVPQSVNRDLLAKIAQGVITHVNKKEGETAGLLHNPPLIEVNMNHPDPNDASKVMCRVTPAGAAYLTEHANPVNEANTVNTTFEVISGAVLPPSRRGGGGGGAPMKYPFDKLEVGMTFFVPATAKLPHPLKTLGSTISSANLRYADQIGEKEVVRAKRGKKNKLILDDAGEKIMETKTVPIWKFNRKFTMRGVEAGKTYGSWTAPANGVLIGRTM